MDTEIDLGIDQDKTPLICSLTEMRNVIIIGSGGTTRFLAYFMISILESAEKQNIHVTMIEPNGLYYGLPWGALPYVTKVSKTEARAALKTIADEVTQRQSMTAGEIAKQPVHVVALGYLSDKLADNIEQIKRICTDGPGVGVFLLVDAGGRYLDVPKKVIDMFHTCLVFGMEREQDSISVTGDLRAAALEHGEVLLYQDGNLLSKFKIYYIDEKVHTNAITSLVEKHTKYQKIPVCLGTTTDGNPYVRDARDLSHIIIKGRIGSGRDIFLSQIIYSITSKASPDECEFVLIDPNGINMRVWDGLPHLVKPVVGLDIGYEELQSQLEHILSRYNTVVEADHTNIDSHNSIAHKRMPIRFIIINEFGYLFENHYNPLWKQPHIECIRTIAKLGPAVGVYLIMASGYNVDIRNIKRLFNTRIALQLSSKKESVNFLGEPGAESLQFCGELLVKETSGDMTKLSVPFIPEEEIAKFVKSQQTKWNK